MEHEADIIVKADNGAGIMATAVGDLIRIGKNWPYYEQVLSGGGWVRARSLLERASFREPLRPSVDDGSQREPTSNFVTDGRHIFRCRSGRRDQLCPVFTWCRISDI